MPRYADRIKHYADTEPIFHRFKIEQEIARITEKKIPLPMGGSIVIESTEALVAIDVNSGNFRADNNAEETAYQMNLQAAREIGRQLRLRDLGGVIVNDFIDMKEERHRRAVEQALRNALRRDRARTKILKTSAFGVIEMTRQRIRPSLKRSLYQDCPHCRATGTVKTAESMSIEIMRLFQLAAHRKTIRTLNAKVHIDVAQNLLNKKRREILQWEEVGQMQIAITGTTGVSPEFLELQGFDNNGNEVKVLASEPPRVAAPEPRRQQGDRDRDRDRDDRGYNDRDRGDRGRGRGGRGRGRGRDR
jgi:ribonuclease E